MPRLELPVCRWLGEEKEGRPGDLEPRYECSSVIVAIGKSGTSARLCAGCSVCNHAPPPSVLQKAANLAVATVKHVAAGLPETPEEEALRRRTLCNACAYRDAKTDTCRHANCGCKLAKKIAWAREHCPLKLW